MSNLGDLENLWDPASLDELLNELSQLAERAFEEKGFDPAIVEEMMAKFEEKAEASWAAMDAAEEEQLRAAEADLNHVMDTGMADLDKLTRHANKEFEKLSHLEKVTWKVTDRTSAAAAASAKRYIDAALATAAAAYASKAANKVRRSHFFRRSRTHPEN